jgi:hypothetical protein
MDQWRFIADRKIREAMEEGAFDRLEGKGRPIPADDAPLADPTLWMAHHVMKNGGYVPPWVAEGNEIECEIQRLRRIHSSACAVDRERLRVEVVDLNRRIASFNLRAPAAVHKLPFSL